jgi:hypothetical protein
VRCLPPSAQLKTQLTYLPKNPNHHEFDQLPRVGVTLAGPSGGAAELSVDTSAGHSIGWSDGFDAKD